MTTKKTITIGGTRYTLTAYSDGVIDIGGPDGVHFGFHGTLADVGLRAKAETAIAQAKANKARASASVQERVETGTAGLGVG